MRRFKLILTLTGVLLILAVPLLSWQKTSAAVLVDAPCSRDLALSKQVKIPGGSFLDAPDAASAPSASVGSHVQWKLSVNNQTTGACTTLTFPLTMLVHDTLPNGFTLVSATGDGSYDSATNNWSFTAADVEGADVISIVLDTTVNQAGSFENVAAFTTFTYCIDGCITANYAIDGPNDPLAADKDQNAANDSANAWVKVQSSAQVLGASTTTPSGPQVLAASTGLANTGTGLTTSWLAGILATTTLLLTVTNRKKVLYKLK